MLKILLLTLISPNTSKILSEVEGPNPPNHPSIELARLGMVQVVVYQHKKPFIYQGKLLKAQDEAKQKKLGIWSF